GMKIRESLDAGDPATARAMLDGVVPTARARETLRLIFDRRDTPGFDDWSAKALADFDYASLRILERTRILVRLRPALGLMGTLTPRSPGRAALAEGDTVKLSEDLRIAFSVTVLGLLVGAFAYAISLVRDRLYSHDLSDLEYLVSVIAPAAPAAEL